MATIWLAPFALSLIGLGLLLSAWLVSRGFDKRYPHLSREAEERERAEPMTPKASRIPVPAFNPEDWNMQSARDEADSERLDRSIHRWRERMTAPPKGPVQPRSRARR